MPKTREQKKKVIEDIKEKIDSQKAIVFVDIKGVPAEEIFGLRESLKKTDCLLIVAKKTLLDIAFKEKKIKIDKEKLEGELGLAFGFSDQISPAKISYQFSLTNDKLKILGGVFENEFIEKEKVLSLAKLPSKEELYAKVVGTIFAPVSNFVNVLQGNIRNLVFVLGAIKK